MTLKPIEGFQHFTTHHCVTGSLRHVYAHNNHDVSEDLLLGVGAGVGFIYWHMKGQPPFIGGRGQPKPSMEEIAGQRTGVQIQPHTTTSVKRARQTLLDMLDAGQPVMIQCDMGFLPYFDFGGEEYHFGGHVVVVCGYDAHTEQVLVAEYMSEGWEEAYGGKLEFMKEADEMIQATLEHIDKKRADLGLPEYDPDKFGQSGDARMEEIEALPIEERRMALYGAMK